MRLILLILIKRGILLYNNKIIKQPNKLFMQYYKIKSRFTLFELYL